MSAADELKKCIRNYGEGMRASAPGGVGETRALAEIDECVDRLCKLVIPAPALPASDLMVMIHRYAAHAANVRSASVDGKAFASVATIIFEEAEVALTAAIDALYFEREQARGMCNSIIREAGFKSWPLPWDKANE